MSQKQTWQLSQVAVYKISALGTEFEIHIPKIDLANSEDDSLQKLLQDELTRIEQKYSRFLDTSLLNSWNAHAKVDNTQWLALDEESATLLRFALKEYRNSNGYFDISLKNRLEDLGYDKNYSFKSSDVTFVATDTPPFALRTKQVFSQWRFVAQTQLQLYRAIEIGGFGKGYAVDSLATVLKQNGLCTFYINGGGDILVNTDTKTHADVYWILHLEHPTLPDRVLGEVVLQHGSLCASAPNKRKWADTHHLLNAKTGEPDDSMIGVFVTGKTAMAADALATTLFSMGFAHACNYAKAFKADVLLISKSTEMFVTRHSILRVYS